MEIISIIKLVQKLYFLKLNGDGGLKWNTI